MINVLYNITLVCTIASKITQSTGEEVCGAGEGTGMDWIATKGKWGGGAHRAVKKDQKRKKRVNRVLAMGGI